MLGVELGYPQIEAVSDILRRMELHMDTYDDPRYFPPKDSERELQLGYFTAMVAIDHRTSTPLGVFEGYVDGEFFHGADLLYRLGKKVFERDPEFFLPGRLAKLTYEDMLPIIKHGDIVLWDLHVRTFLLRDIGKKVMEYYGGEFGKLFNIDTVGAMISRLSIFRAYEDPVHKKIFLLAKFLMGRGLVSFRDRENFEVAVDNHLSRIAIRLDIVRFSEYTPMVKQTELTRDEDMKVRVSIRMAWKEASRLSGHDPFTLDDFLWSFGRRICTRDYPKCGCCPFRNVCLAKTRGEFWYEHRHTITWYY